MPKETRLVYSTETGDTRKKSDLAKPAASSSASKSSAKSPPQVTVRLDTKSRRGKAVTIIANIPHNPQVIEQLARDLKSLCASGGTVEGKDILIQGDHRDKIMAKLTALGYKPKRS